MSNFLRFRNCSLSPFSFVLFQSSSRTALHTIVREKRDLALCNDHHGSSCWLWVQRLSLELMADRRWMIRSYGASVAALLLVTAIGSTLLHWHSDWNDQRCQLCHVRHLPSALGPVAEGQAYPVLTERDWLADNPAYELESFFVRFSSRAPPRSTSFTVS